MSDNQPPELVAIVVPLSNRPELTPEEQISLNHLQHFLGNYDRYIVKPKSLNVNISGFGVKSFSTKFFGSAKAYKKLVLSRKFFKAFIDYKYILIYHLDSLVFSDQLQYWCNTDLDYIGPPWIKHENAPYAGRTRLENKVGNSGFSLRKISSSLRVIDSSRYSEPPETYRKNSNLSNPKYMTCISMVKKFLKHLKIFNNAKWEMARYPFGDDSFWANRSTHYYPGFKIASPENALRFGFECIPEYCFELTNHTLPFGCHAWHKYNRKFWEPYLIK